MTESCFKIVENVLKKIPSQGVGFADIEKPPRPPRPPLVNNEKIGSNDILIRKVQRSEQRGFNAPR